MLWIISQDREERNMKKIISLFVSIIIVLSMLISVAVFNVSAAEPIVIEKHTPILDISSDAVFNSWSYYLSTRYMPKVNGTVNKALYVSTNTWPFENGAIKMMPGSNLEFILNTDPANTGYDTLLYTSGVFKVKFDVKMDAGTTLTLLRLGEIGTSAKYITPSGTFSTVAANSGKWYNVEIIADMDNNVWTAKLLDMETENAEPIVNSDAFTMNTTGAWLRALIPANKNIYIRNINTSHTGYGTLSDITSVDSDGVVEARQNTISFELDTPISGLAAEHISILNGNYEEVMQAQSIIPSSGEGTEITAVMNDDFEGWTNYYLKIDSAVYDGYKRYDGDGNEIPIADIIEGFRTPASEFDARASRTISAGTVTYEAEIANKNIPNLPVTLMLAIYDDETGSMVSITHHSVANCYNPDGSTITETISASIADGQTPKLFMINGWNGMRRLFGREW